VARGLSWVVPAYFHPAVAPRDWLALAALPEVRLVVLNVADGPGERPEPAFADVLATLDEAGVAVAGYVDTDYGQRTDRAIRTDVDRARRLVASRNAGAAYVTDLPGRPGENPYRRLPAGAAP